MFKSIYKIFNPHIHNPKLIAVNDTYTLTYTDTSEVISWSMRYYTCECGERTATATHDGRRGPYHVVEHSGVDAAIKNWVECGVVPSKSYDPATSSYFIKPQADENKNIDPLVNLNKTIQELCVMMNVIKRDHGIESKYPKLNKQQTTTTGCLTNTKCSRT